MVPNLMMALNFQDYSSGDAFYKSVGDDLIGARAADKDPFPGGDYYEQGRPNTSGTGKDSPSGVSKYRSAIEQAGGPRAVQRSDQLLSQIRAINTAKAVRTLKRRGVYDESRRAELGRIQESLHKIIQG